VSSDHFNTPFPSRGMGTGDSLPSRGKGAPPSLHRGEGGDEGANNLGMAFN